MFDQPPRVLEVGSGSVGFGHMLPYRFWGCDVVLGPVHSNMTAVQGSATRLPFADKSFDVVVSLDTIEHIPTEEARRTALQEMERLASRALIVGYPSGNRAYEADEALAAYKRSRRVSVPAWLEEHIAHRLPSEDWLEKTDVARTSCTQLLMNESVDVHLQIMRRETHVAWAYLFQALILVAKPLMQRWVRRIASTSDSYRRIYVMTRDSALAERAVSTPDAGAAPRLSPRRLEVVSQLKRP